MNNVINFDRYSRIGNPGGMGLAPGPERRISSHVISRIMFEPQFIEADAQGRVLCARIQYGSVILYIEETLTPKEKVRLKFEGFRDVGIPHGAQYVGSVFEHGDEAHIYLTAGSHIES